MSKPHKIDQIDFDKIGLCKPKLLKSSKIDKLIKFKYNGNRLLIQTPELKYDNDVINSNSIYEINLPISCTEKEMTPELLNFLLNLDKFVMSKGKTNCQQWFGSAKQIKYKSIVRKATVPNEISKNGVFKLKMKKNDKDIKITKNRQFEPIDISEIPDKCVVKAIIEPFAVWVKKNEFGVYLKPVLLDFRETFEEINFLDDSSDEVNDIDILETEMEYSSVDQSSVPKSINDTEYYSEVTEDKNINSHLDSIEEEGSDEEELSKYIPEQNNNEDSTNNENTNDNENSNSVASEKVQQTKENSELNLNDINFNEPSDDDDAPDLNE